jgi:SM-20-related protein
MLRNLEVYGWSQHDFFLSNDVIFALAKECLFLKDTAALKLAGVGRGVLQAVHAKVRGDQISWLACGQSAACDTYLQAMEAVRLILNKHLYLGLEEYESHFAYYEPGATYLKHLDRFRDNDSRTVSAVLYLNANWLLEEGGALRLHPAGQAEENISPDACRLVLFMSADILHEVLPATRDRLSIAGWFKRRP